MLYNIGDTIKTKKGESGKIVSIEIKADGITYQMEAKEVDIMRKEIVNGIVPVKESEIERKV